MIQNCDAYSTVPRLIANSSGSGGANNLALLPVPANVVDDSNSHITLTQAKQRATYENIGWDFDTVWGIDPNINDGFPYLKVFTDDVILGDVNGDGKIDIRDLILLARYMVGDAPFTSRQMKATDMNQDGKIDSIDYVMLSNLILNQD